MYVSINNELYEKKKRALCTDFNKFSFCVCVLCSRCIYVYVYVCCNIKIDLIYGI